jgi:hypothetical protein
MHAAVVEHLERSGTGCKWELVKAIPVKMFVSRECHTAWVFRRLSAGSDRSIYSFLSLAHILRYAQEQSGWVHGVRTKLRSQVDFWGN